jgi:GNAT superfamily N-acetyltransferase
VSLEPKRVRNLPDDFGALRGEAASEGFGFLDRLTERWRDGGYCGDAQASLWVVQANGGLIAVGAQTEDEYDPSPLHRRIRHFYVLPQMRRQGVGRTLAHRLIDDGFDLAPRLHLRATHALSTAFWEAVGFQRVGHIHRSHELRRA